MSYPDEILSYEEMRSEGEPVFLKIHRARAGASSRSAAPGTLVSSTPDGLEVACADGSLWLVELQPEGRRRMSAAEFVAGHRLASGTAPFVM